MPTRILTLIVFLTFSFSVNAQKYKLSNEFFDFSFTKEGKMKVVLKANLGVLEKSLSTLEANNEIILTQDEYTGIWKTYADGKMGDSIVKFGEWSTPYKYSFCFLKKDGQLIYSERILIKDDPLMVTNPDTGESIEGYDDNGNPMYDYSTAGGLVERINLKDGKSVFKKEGYSLMNLYGDKLLLIKTTAADGALWNEYTLTDWKGTIYFTDKNQKDIYADDNNLMLLVNQPKAEKIIIKNDEEYFDGFGFISNGKMGFSSIGRGIMAEADKDFQFVGDMKYYYENNQLYAKIPESQTTLTGKNSIQSVFYAHDYYTEYFVDGKIATPSSDAVYGTWSPAYANAETFVKIGNCIIYSKPYIAPPDMGYESEGFYQPTESQLGTLVIYDLVKKEIVFNKKGFTFLNQTDKGFLVQRLKLEMRNGFYTGGLEYTYYTLDKSGKLMTDEISREDFTKNPSTMLSLLPNGSAAVSSEFNYMGHTLTYSLNGKIGVFSEHSGADRAPEMKWRMGLSQGDLEVKADEIMTPDDTINFSGNKPYCDKILLTGYRNFIAFGDSKMMIEGYTGNTLKLDGPITFDLVDTNCVIKSVEFKNKLVIQNISGEVRIYPQFDYDEYGADLVYNLNSSGDTLFNLTIDARSGVFDLEKSKWLVPSEYFRVIPTDKYFVASYFAVSNSKELTRAEFKKNVSNIKFVVYDLKGIEVARGNAADVKKKSGVDVNSLQYKY